MSEEEKAKVEEKTQEAAPTEAKEETAKADPIEEKAEEVIVEAETNPTEAKEEIKEIKQIEKTGARGRRDRRPTFDPEAWKPKTSLGKQVKAGEVTSMSDILASGERVLEVEIVDKLCPELSNDLLLIGQAKGKFGGGQRRVFRQTQKKTMEGNKPKFSTLAVVGNQNGLVGIGYGKAKETVPSREKAFRNAKLNLIQIRRGSGSWEDTSTDPHSIPFKVRGKCGSVTMELIPAPRGTGLSIEKECAKILAAAGIQNVWSKSYGHTKTKLNMLKACFNALKQLSATKINQAAVENLGIVNGPVGEAQ